MNLLLGIIKDIANIFSNKTRKFIAAFFLIIGLSMIVFAMKLSSDSDIFSGALGGILSLIGLMFSFLALVFLPPLDLEPFLMAQLDEQLESERESLEEEMKSDPS
tara:strand:+ start:641 stop:955 length:315 start_codon:yes stop_codon:yes gene_type:complete